MREAALPLVKRFERVFFSYISRGEVEGKNANFK